MKPYNEGMQQDTPQLIKEKLPVDVFLRSYFNLLPAGRNFKALCPFHKEKTPSFIVSPDRGSWHCFGCNIGGDIFAFLMKYENIEFFEALKILAEKTGIVLEKMSGGDAKRSAVLYEINELAAKYFQAFLALTNPQAELARHYLSERGLQKETIETFGIGLAGIATDALTGALLKKGYTVSDIERAGLTLKTERGTYWDRFRNRLMFPIKNHFGKVVGFTGRVLPGNENENVGKYVNSPETPVFGKSKILFGFSETKNAIRETKTAVLVEGQMDFLMSWQDGIKNVVATSGTAVTLDHLNALERLAEMLVIAFDKDEAGHAATERVIDLSSGFDFSVKVAALSQSANAKDPADIVRETPGLFLKNIQNSLPAMKYLFARYWPGAHAETNLRKQALRELLKKVNRIKSPVEQTFWIQELSAHAGISAGVLMSEMSNLSFKEIKKIERAETKVREESEIFQPRENIIADRLIALGLENETLKNQLMAHKIFFPARYESIIENLSHGSTEKLPEEISLIMLKVSAENASEIDREKEFQALAHQLKYEYYRVKQENLSERIAALEKEENKTELNKAMKEFDEVSRHIHNT